MFLPNGPSPFRARPLKTACLLYARSLLKWARISSSYVCFWTTARFQQFRIPFLLPAFAITLFQMRMINSNASLLPLPNLKYPFYAGLSLGSLFLVPHSLKRWNGYKWTSRRRPALGLALTHSRVLFSLATKISIFRKWKCSHKVCVMASLAPSPASRSSRTERPREREQRPPRPSLSLD